MPKCNTCNSTVLRTDAFCGTCGSPVPGGKPVAPIARDLKPSGVHDAPDLGIGTFPRPPTGANSAQAIAMVSISDPALSEPANTDPHRTAIREREPQSEPAQVVPLHRKKNGTASERLDDPVPAEPEGETPRAPFPERDTSLPNIPVPPAPPILASDLLREQMRPSSPGDKPLRRTAVVLSGLCAVAVLLTGGVHRLTFVSLAILTTTATLALTPMSYRGRAIALFLVGCASTSIAIWQQSIHGIAPAGAILAGGTILLSGSLLFRAYYRGARLARWAVTCGVLILGGWTVAPEAGFTCGRWRSSWSTRCKRGSCWASRFGRSNRDRRPSRGPRSPQSSRGW